MSKMKTCNFRFRNYEDRHINDLLQYHWDDNFISLKRMWIKDHQYIEYTVEILEELCQNNFNKQDFEDHGRDIYYVEYKEKKDINMTEDNVNKIITKLDKLRSIYSWDFIKGHIVEFIVKFVFTNKLNMKLFIEPDIYYKKKPLIYRNPRVGRKNFDILAHKKRSFFILGEVKTNLISCINSNDLTSDNKKQLYKIDDIEHYLLNSETRSSKPPTIKKYYIVLNSIDGITLNSLRTYDLIKVSTLLSIKI